ncbi:uncharacterized protein LOC133901043 [Phragmites australis]|uniref:uncharacterized protein LOC133901043 n=1 Tax=Phragmites australis TaxID=29695 RepID=UPI002D78D04A|nr:uncharacterized protein LOC133901043 [Phragmites australis]
MAEPWVILGRIPRVATDDAEAGHDANADFFVPVALPPRVTVLTAARSAHPDRERPDTYPYILAAGPECLLVHFSAKPFCGAHFGVNPHESYLVLSRRFRMAAGEITASAERVSDRPVSMPAIRNIQSIGLVPYDLGRGYMIADLQVDKGSDRAKLLRFQSGRDQWFETDLRCPLDAQDREWVPAGVVSLDHKFWWFDLSWGILSCDPFVADPELLFHGLPQGRDLDMAGPDIHDHRCITVSQNELRYVEVTPEVDDVGEAATVFMWTWTPALGGRTGRWEVAYEMSFAEIWNDDSYHLTGLPEKVPVLAVVCPSNPNLVYFSLDHHLFGVNMPLHTVVELETYELVTTACPTTASCRYVLAWDLPPCVATGNACLHFYKCYCAS